MFTSPAIKQIRGIKKRLLRRKTTRSNRRLRLETLEPRLALAGMPFTPGNILVSNSPFDQPTVVYEYTPAGVKVQEIPVANPQAISTEKGRDLVIDSKGRVELFNGTFLPSLTCFDPGNQCTDPPLNLPSDISHTTFPTWNTSNNPSYGGIAALGDFVYATDQRVGNDPSSSRGIVRFNVNNLRSGWTQNFDADIGDTQINTSKVIPHLTVRGTGDGSTDYYSLTVTKAGARAIFDIDGADTGVVGSVLLGLKLLDNQGNVLAFNNGGNPINYGQGGSTGTGDPYLEYRFAEPGQYLLQIGSCCPFDVIPAGTKYDLQISLEGHSLFIPGGSGILKDVEPNNTVLSPQNTDSAERFGLQDADPIDVTIGLNGNLYVLVSANSSTSGGNRVDEYDPLTLQFIRSIDLPREHRAIAVDQAGTIFASEPGLWHYDAFGNTLNALDDPGLGGLLSDIDIQPDGRLIAASSNGHVLASNTSFDGINFFQTRASNGYNFVAFVAPPVNLPTAADDTFSVLEDTANNTFNVLVNDLVDSRGQLTIISPITNISSGGTATVIGGRSIRYSPAANFTGTETFRYTTVDGLGGTASATVRVTVVNVNEDPIALPFATTVNEDSNNNILDLQGSVSFAPDTNETLSLTQISNISNGGTVTIVNGMTLRYTPVRDFTGVETFVYKISDGNGGTASSTASITVTNANDNPTAVNDRINVNPNSTDVTLDVLANDSFLPDINETLTITAVSPTDKQGTVSIAVNGLSLVYSPAAGFKGLEKFTYTISDNNGSVATATVTVNVDVINNPPVAGDNTFNVRFNSVRNNFPVLENDTTDPDPNETMTITAVSVPDAGGQVTITPDGKNLRYTPLPQVTGVESFKYTVTDSRGASSDAKVTVNIGNFNGTPVSDPDFFIVRQNSTDVALDVLANDYDPDPTDAIRLISASTSVLGSFAAVSADRTRLLYTPKRPFLGRDTITYVLSDGNGGTSTGVATITVSGWQNANTGRRVEDVTNDGSVVPQDALIIINELNSIRPNSLIIDLNGSLRFPADVLPVNYFDVSGDGYLTPQDALIVINFLNSIGLTGEGEDIGGLDAIPVATNVNILPETTPPNHFHAVPTAISESALSQGTNDLEPTGVTAITTAKNGNRPLFMLQSNDARTKPAVINSEDESSDIFSDSLEELLDTLASHLASRI